jgi:beta-phosphoglucomutase-like phosphatase (HAD superfamily)
MKIAIYDMDGTIVDSSHRYRTITDETTGKTRIDLEYWRANEYRAMDDGLLPLAAQYMEDIANPDVYVIIATARVLHAPDTQFIKEILGEPNYIISRGAEDTRSGSVLKINGLQRFFNLKQFRLADAVFYEDNVSYLKAVCDHFQIRGVYIPSVQGH